MSNAAEGKRAHLYTFLGALLVCAGVVLWMIGPYCLALFLGGTAAMLCQPAQQWFLTKMQPAFAAGAVAALALLLIVVPMAAFSILAVRQGVEIGRDLSELKEFSPRRLTAVLSRYDLVRTLVGDPAAVNARLKAAIQASGKFTGDALLSLSKDVPDYLLQLALALIAFYFFLLDGERFVEWALAFDVFDRNVQKRLVEAFRDTAISAVLAGLASAAAQAVLIILGFLALDVPGAFLAGGLTFFIAWIPVLGTVPASLAGVFFLYAQGETLKLALMVVLGLTAGIIDNLVRPWVLKGRADMHPLTGLLAVVGGIRLFGILGVFIGPILTAMLLALLRIWPELGRRYGISAKSSA